MRWTKKAEEAISRVPFLVRKRVKKRVEEEAASYGAKEVTIDHVLTCQKRFMNRMEDEVKGFQVETCFGPTGCLDHYTQHCVKGERFGEILEKTGMKDIVS